MNIQPRPAFGRSVLLSFGAFVLLYLAACATKSNPGGTYVSLSADILPHLLAAKAAVLALRGYRSLPLSKRLAAIFIAGLAAFVSALTGLSTYLFFHREYLSSTYSFGL